MKIKNHLLVIFFISLLYVLTYSKFFTQDFAFPLLRRNKGWTFLDRLALGQGHAQIRFKAKIVMKENQTTKTYAIDLSMVPDRIWASEELMKCSRDDQGEIMSSSLEAQVKQQIFKVVLSPDNGYSFDMLQVVQIPKTQTYHFILKDCEKQLVSEYFSRQARLVIELQIKNNNKDYGEDQASNFYWLPLLIIGTGVMLKFLHKSFVSKYLDAKDTDYVKILICSCIWINLFSLLFKYVGYLIYYFFGMQFGFFEFMYLLFHSIGDSIIVSVFILVSYGWTITFLKATDFDLYIPLLAMMGLISLILTLLNLITDGSHDKYHMFDTIPSYLLVFFKVVLNLIFLGGCIKTIISTKNNKQVKSFMFEILILGTLYISSVPLVMLIVQYIPASARKEWVFIVIQLGKTFISFLLTYMISYKKSGYRSIAFGEQSFMQENGRIL